jgi:hypothetical protein
MFETEEQRKRRFLELIDRYWLGFVTLLLQVDWSEDVLDEARLMAAFELALRNQKEEATKDRQLLERQFREREVS